MNVYSQEQMRYFKYTLSNAIETISRFQKWRRGANIPMPDPKEVGVCIDFSIRVLRALRLFSKLGEFLTLYKTLKQSHFDANDFFRMLKYDKHVQLYKKS